MNWRNAFSMGSAALVVVVLIGIILMYALPVDAKPLAASVILGIHTLAYGAVPFIIWFAALPAVWTPRKKRIAIWLSTFVSLLTALMLVLQWVAVPGWNQADILRLTVGVLITLLLIDVIAGWVNNLLA